MQFKALCYPGYLGREVLTKTVRVMKLTAILLFATCLQVSAKGYAQSVTLSEKNATLEKVFRKIKNQSGYTFVYRDEWLKKAGKVDIDLQNAPIEQALEACFKNQPLTYTLVKTTVVVRLKPTVDIQPTVTDENPLPPPIDVHGRVVNEKGEPLQGASITEKGTKNITVTDAGGNFNLKVKDEKTVISISYTGYKTKEVAVDKEGKITIVLAAISNVLDEVVVSALGIQRKSSKLTYATQTVSGNELTKVPEANFMNSLSGKASGVSIYRNASGVGGSVKVLLRGNKSAQGNNQPLYVINGVPMTNFSRESINQSFSSMDQGDGISNLNPDDIESISILKGASAAALYGSAAANGVILITTKKGKVGLSKVNFSSSFTIDKVAYKPELQNLYGQTAPGTEESWGSPISNAKDNISGFFKNGKTWINSISFSSGTDKMQTYISYANTTANGVMEGNKMSRHNIDIRQTSHFLNDKLSIDANVNIMSQVINNPPVSGIQGSLYGLYGFPRGLDFAPYKNYEIFDPNRNVNTQNWPFITANNQNPYWLANRNLFENKRNRTMLNVTAKYDITDWLNFQLRGNVDRINDINTIKYYLGTAVAYGGVNGGYSIGDRTYTAYYGDALLNFTRSYGKMKVNGLLGTSIADSRFNGEAAGSILLYIPNVFTIQNMNPANGGYGSSGESHGQLQAVFGSISLSYNDWLSLDITGRNDWSSSLSFTPNGSYFYPSVGVSLLLHQLLKLPEAISFAKLRGSYAIVGNTVPAYVTNPQNYIDGRGNVYFNNTAPFTDLKPEKTKSLELGAEIRFLKDQFNLNFTYYKTNSINQFFSIVVPPGTGFSNRFINGGDIQNSGIELTVGYTTLPEKTLKWNASINFSTNKNVVKELATDIDQFLLTNDVNGYYSILKAGGSYGDLYGTFLKRDEKGRVVIGADGKPVAQSGAPGFLGNSNPKFQLGWNNSFNYKNFSFSFLFNGNFGGKVMSLTEQILDGLGVSKASGDARTNGGVTVNGVLDGTNTPVTTVDVKKWYQKIGGVGGVTDEYMYDATNVRLRELSFGYSLPNTMLKNSFVKSIRLSLIGRNLVYLYKKAPFDPDIIFSSGNGYSGVDILSLPATRSFGLNLNVTF